ncbi:MAG: isoprenylcysteine carboxylmethyltransferase family protein [Bacteroidetes bacterium]|nr:MAG: isoprenylcysteine carboxylmethyltransferase family protein [Bacteroidota bacterium]
MNIIGKMPIPAPFVIIGKLAMLCNWLFFLLKYRAKDMMIYDSNITQITGLTLGVVGFSIVMVSLVTLGRTVTVGLPAHEIKLKTNFIYAISRNPIYVGAFMMCAGSCFFALHWLNIFLFGLTFGIHYLIVLKEEEFLAEKFGQEWQEYKRRVPRYIGRVRRS